MDAHVLEPRGAGSRNFGVFGPLHAVRAYQPLLVSETRPTVHAFISWRGMKEAMFNPARDRMVSLSAIGQSLKHQYDGLTPPMPPHLAALVEQLKTQK